MERRARSKRAEINDDVDFANMTPEQIQAEKLRRQKLIEEADLEVAKEMLGWCPSLYLTITYPNIHI